MFVKMYVNLVMAMSCLYSTVNTTICDDDDDDDDLKCHLTTDPVCACGHSIETAEYFFTLGYCLKTINSRTD